MLDRRKLYFNTLGRENTFKAMLGRLWSIKIKHFLIVLATIQTSNDPGPGLSEVRIVNICDNKMKCREFPVYLERLSGLWTFCLDDKPGCCISNITQTDIGVVIQSVFWHRLISMRRFDDIESNADKYFAFYNCIQIVLQISIHARKLQKKERKDQSIMPTLYFSFYRYCCFLPQVLQTASVFWVILMWTPE